VRGGSRATLVVLGAFLALGIVNNLAAAAFAGRFGVGLLDLDGGSSVLSPGGPAGLPESGPDRVGAILDRSPAGATGVHVLLTLTLDLLFPVAGVLFGVIASRNLRPVLGAPRVVARIGVALAVGYGVSELLENTLEVLLLSGPSSAWAAAAVAALHVGKNALAGALLALLATGYLTAGALRLSRLTRSRSRPSGPAIPATPPGAPH